MENKNTQVQESQTDPKKQTVKQTPQEFSAKIKEKYPQYKDIDDVELAKKIVSKYPVYESQVDFTLKKKEESSSTEPSPELDSETKEEVGSSATPETKYVNETFGPDGKSNSERFSKESRQENFANTTNQSIKEGNNSEIEPLLNDYISQVSLKQEDLDDIENTIKKEEKGDFGWFNSIKDIASRAWTGKRTPNEKEVGVYNVKKELAKRQGVSIEEVDSIEAEKTYTENRRIELANQKRQEKTEEFIEDLGEEGQAKLNNHFKVKANNLTAKSKSLLLNIEASKNELDAIGPEYAYVVDELNEISDSHDDTKQYEPEYYQRSQDLRNKALELESRIKELGGSLKQNASEFSNTQDDLLSTQEEIDLFKRNYGTLDNFTGKFNVAAGDMALSLGYLANKINYANPLTRAGSLSVESKIIQGKQEIEEKREGLRKGKSVDDINSWEDAAEWALDLVATQAPNTILMATTGGASLGVMGVSSAGAKLYELEKSNAEGTANYSELEKYASAFITGTAEALSEKVSVGQIGAAKRVFSSVAKRELKENTFSYLKRTFPKYIQDTVEEGGTESLSQLAENITDKYLLGDENVNLTDGLKESFISGAFMSGVVYKAPGLARDLTRPFIRKDINQAIGENFEKIAAINTQLNNDINETTRKKLEAKKESLLNQNKDALDKSLNNIDNLSSKEKGQLLAIEKEKHKLRKEADDVLNETEIDKETKESLLEEIKENVKRLEAKKESILNKESEVANDNKIKETTDNKTSQEIPNPSQINNEGEERVINYKNEKGEEASLNTKDISLSQDKSTPETNIVTPKMISDKVSEIKSRETISDSKAYKQAVDELSEGANGVITPEAINKRAEEIKNESKRSESEIYRQAVKEISDEVSVPNAKPNAEEVVSKNSNLITSERIDDKVNEIKTRNNISDSEAYSQAARELSSEKEGVITPDEIKARAKDIKDKGLSNNTNEAEIYKQAIKEIEAEIKQTQTKTKPTTKPTTPVSEETTKKEVDLDEGKVENKRKPLIDNKKIDVSKLPIVEDKNGKKYYKTGKIGAKGVSKYIPVGEDVYIDEHGIERPSETEKGALSGIYMSDSEFTEVKQNTNETTPKQDTQSNGDVQSGTKTDTKQGQDNNIPKTVDSKTSKGKTEITKEYKLGNSDKAKPYTVTFKDGVLTIKDSKGKEPSVKTKRKVLDKYADDIDFTQGKIADVPQGVSNPEEFIANESENPVEIAQQLSNLNTKEYIENSIDYKTRIIADHLGNVEKQSYIDFGDRNNIGFNMAKSYFSKKGKGRALDTLAQELSDDYGIEITEQDLVKHMETYTGGKNDVYKEFRDEKKQPLENKFTELTGLPANDKFINKAINQAIEKEKQSLEAENNYLDTLTDEELISLSKEQYEYEQFRKENTETNSVNEIGPKVENTSRSKQEPEVQGGVAEESEGTKKQELDSKKEFDAKLGKDKPKPIKSEPQSKSTEVLEDYGEKIGGARKDIYNSFDGLTGETIESQPLSKSFPEPDYKKLTEEGVLSEKAAVILKFLYDSIPTKPRAKHKKKYWANKVQNVIDMYKDLVVDNDNSEANADTLDKRISESIPKYVVFKEIMKAVGFPSENIKLGSYDIVKPVSENDNKYLIVKGYTIIGDFKTMEDAVVALKELLKNNSDKKRKVALEVWITKATGEISIGWRGSGRVVDLMTGFKTTREAHKFLKENYDTLEKQFLDMKVNPNERRESNRVRVGNDWRKGKNVSSEAFGEIFGFRGVEFGNWVNKAERQEAINEAYDAFMDMANILGITPKSLSLNGTLAMAFGARGKSKAMAHYEPGKVVINLTKKKGAGSLAHEWFHALDNHLERLRTNEKGLFLTEAPRQKRLRDGSMDARINPKTIEAFKALMDAINKSGLKERSAKLDQFRSKAYWGTPIEMAARSFENYIIEALGKNNEQNDFLANFKQTGEWLSQSGLEIDNYPYPLKEESDAINEAFQNLFETLQVGTKDGKDYFVQEEDTTGIDLANKLGIERMANLLDELQNKLDKGTEGTLGIHIPAAIAQVAITAMKVAVKTAKTTADVISAGIDAIKKTEWYGKLTDKRKADINEYNLQSVIKTATKSINELENNIADLRQRIKDGKVSKKEAFNEIKNFLKSNKLKGKVTPTEINRLINKASRLLIARDSNKAMDQFVEEFMKVEIKARRRAITKRDKNKDIDSKFVADMTARLINEGKSLDEVLEYFELPREKKAAEAVWARMKNENFTEESALADMEKTYQEAQDIINKKKTTKEIINDTRRQLIKLFSDRQYLPKKLVKASGMKGTFNLFVNSKGSSGRANRIFEDAYNNIYKNLSKEDRGLLDMIIQARRVIAIDKNREDRGLGPVNHPNNTFRAKEEAGLEGLKNKIGDKKFNDLDSRATAYFDVFKQILADAEKSGLVSQQVKDMFENVDYQPRLFLQFITNFNEEVSTKNEVVYNNNNGGLSRDQIATMKEGDAGKLMTDSAWLLSTTLNTRYKSIAINNINKKFMTEEFPKAKERYEKLLEDQENRKELSREDKRFIKYFKELDSKIIDNPAIGVTESGNPKYKYDSTPPHFAKAYYYVNGVQHQFFIEKELHEAWFDNLNGFLGANAKEFISYASGSALVKGIATGNNPAFAIVNTPRDFMFTAVFSNQYSGILPKAMFQVAKDSIKAIRTIARAKSGDDTNLFNKYIEYGGDMSFLSTQGRLSKKTHLGKAIEGMTNPKFKDKAKTFFDAVTLKKFSTYSEIMFRMALFQRSIKNQLKTLGVESINDINDQEKIDDIYNEAVANARGLLDFNQGGVITKDMESFIPYINTGVQGTRVAFDALKSDPKTVTSKILQAAALGTAAPIGISLSLISMLKDDEDEEKSIYEIYIDAINGVSKYQKSQYFNIVTGRKVDGEYEVIKIAKNQQLIPVLSLTDNIVQNRIRKSLGQKKRATQDIYSDAWFAFNTNIMPLDITSGAGMITRTPTIKATLTYATGHDFFRDQPLTNDINKVPREVEGFKSNSVEDFYKVFGEETGLSPARTKGAVEAMITSPSTNPFVGMLYGGADASVSDEGFKESSKKFGNTFLKSFNKRLVSTTSDFNRTVEANERVKEYIDKIKADKLRHDFYGNKVAKAFANGEISGNEFAKELKEKYPEDVSRLLNKAKDLKMMKGVDRNVINIKYEQNTKAKAYLIAYHYGDIFDGSADSKEVLIQMKKAGGIITKDVLLEFTKLREELGLTNK